MDKDILKQGCVARHCRYGHLRNRCQEPLSGYVSLGISSRAPWFGCCSGDEEEVGLEEEGVQVGFRSGADRSAKGSGKGLS